MNEKDLDSLIERVKAQRDSALPAMDADSVWQKVGRERVRQSRAVHRAAAFLSAAAILLVAGVSSALLYNAGPFKRSPGSARASITQRHLDQADRVIAAFRTEMEGNGEGVELRKLAGDLAIISQNLRRSARLDSVDQRRLEDTEFVLTQIASYEPAHDLLLRELDLIEYSVRLQNDWPIANGEQLVADTAQREKFLTGRRALAERNYTRAVELLTQATRNAERDLRAHARYWLSYAHYRRGSEQRNATELQVAQSTLSEPVAAESQVEASASPEEQHNQSAEDLRTRIDAELASMGDTSAIASMGVLASAFIRDQRVVWQRITGSMSAKDLPVERRRQAILALATREGAASTKLLKTVAEAKSAAPTSPFPPELRLVSIRALAALNLAPPAYIEALTLNADSSADGRAVVATIGSLREATGAAAGQRSVLSPVAAVAATASSMRDVVMVPAHSDPQVELKRVISPDKLASITPSALLADRHGNVFVIDRIAKMLVTFNSAGARAASIPGNSAGAVSYATSKSSDFRLRSINAATLWGDTIVVADSVSRELAFINRAGQILSRRGWPVGVTTIKALYNTQSNVVGVGSAAGGSTRSVWFKVTARGLPEVMQPSFEHASTATLACSDRARGVVHDVNAPFAPYGDFVTVTPEGDIAHAERDSIAIDILDARSGQLRRSVSAPFDRARLSDSVWYQESAAVRELQSRLPSAVCTPPVTRPTFEPAVYSLSSDERGRFWLEVHGSNGRQLLILDPTLAVMESATMPRRDPGVQPYITGNTMYFVAPDSASGKRAVYALIKK